MGATFFFGGGQEVHFQSFDPFPLFILHVVSVVYFLGILVIL